MGVLFRRTDEDSQGWNDYKTGIDDESFFQDAITEIRTIINSSDFEKDSTETATTGFEMDIIKTKHDLSIVKCNSYNKFSKNKKFSPFQSGEEWHCKCENFIDGVDITIENRRARIDLNFSTIRLHELYAQLQTKTHDNEHRVIDCFRMYWTYEKSPIYLYQLKDHPLWQMEISDCYYNSLFNGFSEVFKVIKPKVPETKR